MLFLLLQEFRYLSDQVAELTKLVVAQTAHVRHLHTLLEGQTKQVEAGSTNLSVRVDTQNSRKAFLRPWS